MTGLQLALLAGGLIGLGVSAAVWRFAAATPDVEDALARLSPQGISVAVEGHPRLPTCTAGSACGRCDRSRPGGGVGSPPRTWRSCRCPGTASTARR